MLTAALRLRCIDLALRHSAGGGEMESRVNAYHRIVVGDVLVAAAVRAGTVALPDRDRFDPHFMNGRPKPSQGFLLDVHDLRLQCLQLALGEGCSLVAPLDLVAAVERFFDLTGFLHPVRNSTGTPAADNADGSG